MTDFVVHSKTTGAQISLKADSKAAALTAAAELLDEPLTSLATYQLNDW